MFIDDNVQQVETMHALLYSLQLQLSLRHFFIIRSHADIYLLLRRCIISVYGCMHERERERGRERVGDMAEVWYEMVYNDVL